MKKIYLFITVFFMLFSTQMKVSAEEGVFYNDDILIEDEQSDTLLQSPSNGILNITIQQEGKQFIPEKPVTGDLIKKAEPIYRFRYKVTAKQMNGKAVKNRYIRAIRYTGPVQGCKFTNINSSGVGYIDIDVRGVHKFTVFCEIANCGLRSNVVTKTPTLRAEYQEMFYCTAYHTPCERDFRKGKISAKGIKGEVYKKDFLNAVMLNGSGKALSGEYIQYNSSQGIFYKVHAPMTATGTKPRAGITIAVDPYFIPRAKINGVWKKATVKIDGLGKRTAEDGGGSIKKYRIDVYLGEGKTVMNKWSNSYRKVTLESIN